MGFYFIYNIQKKYNIKLPSFIGMYKLQLPDFSTCIRIWIYYCKENKEYFHSNNDSGVCIRLTLLLITIKNSGQNITGSIWKQWRETQRETQLEDIQSLRKEEHGRWLPHLDGLFLRVLTSVQCLRKKNGIQGKSGLTEL